MSTYPILSSRRKINVFGFFLTGLIAFFCAWRSGGLSLENLKVPFGYSGDALWSNVFIKTIIENGWYLTNPRLGAPYGYQAFDFPMADGLHLFLIWIFSLISKLFFQASWVWVLNVYSLFTFPLTAWIAFFCLRASRISTLSSVCAATLFALVPYHWQRLGGHIFLASYYMIPFSVLVLLDLIRSPKKHLLRNSIIAFLTGCAGVYYAFFFCYFLVIAALLSTARKRIQTLKTATIITVVTLIGISANVAPSIYFWNQHGKNTSILGRNRSDTETFGLKVTQMILPVNGHRSELLRLAKDKYNETTLINENFTTTLGLVGSIGFFFLIGFILFSRSRNNRLRHLAVFNLSAVLLATVGGFSSILALMKFTQIRSYNRISIFIVYFCLMSVFLFLNTKKWKHQKATAAAVLLILLFGIWDQSPKGLARPFDRNKTALNNDSTFFESLETQLPEKSMILQLPFVNFPEQGYDGFRGYLNTKTLRWSFGAMRGRDASLSLEVLSSLPAQTLSTILPGLGFSAVLVDLESEQGKNIDHEFTTALKPTLQNKSDDGRFSYYILSKHPAQNVIQSKIDISGNDFEPNDESIKLVSKINLSAMKQVKALGTVDDVVSAPPEGWLQNQYLIIKGWTVDPSRQYAVKDIVVQDGDRFLPMKVFDVNRPDVTLHLKKPSITNAGWVALLPLKSFESGAHEVNVRALSKDGTVLTIDKSTVKFSIKN